MAKRIDFTPSSFDPIDPYRHYRRDGNPLEISLQVTAPRAGTWRKVAPGSIAGGDIDPHILLVAGMGDGEELWALRQHDSGLYLYRGNEGSIYLGPGPAPGETLSLGVSYNPMTGAISVAAGKKTWTGRARCSWAQPDQERADWQLWLGCPLDGRADYPPIGWTFTGEDHSPVTTVPRFYGVMAGLAGLVDPATKRYYEAAMGTTDALRGSHRAEATIKDSPLLDIVPAEEIRSVLRELGIDHLTDDDEEEEEIKMHWDAVVTLGAVAAQEIPADAATISRYAAELLEEHLKWAAVRRSHS